MQCSAMCLCQMGPCDCGPCSYFSTRIGCFTLLPAPLSPLDLRRHADLALVGQVFTTCIFSFVCSFLSPDNATCFRPPSPYSKSCRSVHFLSSFHKLTWVSSTGIIIFIVSFYVVNFTKANK